MLDLCALMYEHKLSRRSHKTDQSTKPFPLVLKKLSVQPKRKIIIIKSCVTDYKFMAASEKVVSVDVI